MAKQDKVFSNLLNEIVDFEFDENVADVFEDMLHRSVPGYATVIKVIGMFTKMYAQPESNCYDLGCSLGAAALSVVNNLPHNSCEIIAIDNSDAMIRRAGQLLKRGKSNMPVNLVCADIREVEIRNASIVILNYTLQFIPPDDRHELINKIFNGLNPGGVLILSEKIKFSNPEENERQINLYHNYKRLHGYSDLEISQKRDALENVLIPETVDRHIKRLKGAGFVSVFAWFRLFNFASFIAVK